MAEPSSNAPCVTGDQVRDTSFWPPLRGGTGYDSREVDDLVRRVAAELDADRPAGPVIEHTALRTRSWGRRYDIDAVDWFFGQYLLLPGYVELAGIDADPWRELAVARLDLGGLSRAAKSTWRSFSPPGTQLCWGRAGRQTELRAAEQETLVSVRHGTFSTGGRSFKRASAMSRPPGVTELSTRAWYGQFAKRSLTSMLAQSPGGRPLVDETGTAVLYATREHLGGRARSSIIFPDQRWLRFPVRGDERQTAAMTAVDQSGNKVARYKILAKGLDPGRSFGLSQAIEITVHPSRELTDELTLALAISAEWLGPYFNTGGGG